MKCIVGSAGCRLSCASPFTMSFSRRTSLSCEKRSTSSEAESRRNERNEGQNKGKSQFNFDGSYWLNKFSHNIGFITFYYYDHIHHIQTFDLRSFLIWWHRHILPSLVHSGPHVEARRSQGLGVQVTHQLCTWIQEMVT